ncbi:DELLA protein RGL1-like [Salvia miltiorrhiza]|uniref:DELLA protein RGL1-like n=1 Tax=Salvia miltiorrhiza TaxID=226208 RepID=UPI0025ABD93C|nr:DELLA protein RGL1-like [Salvia miltiorrhiza]
MAAKCGGENEKTPCNCCEAKQETSSPFTILHKYQSQVKRFKRGNTITPAPVATPHAQHQHLPSAEAIVRLAKLRLLHKTPQDSENLRDVELVLEAGEKLSQHKFECAEMLLDKCILISDKNAAGGRAVKFFAEALRERLDSETGKIDLERKAFDLEECLLTYQSVILACEDKLPSSQIAQFTAIQAILDSIGSAKTIHLIDFGIKSGLHWSVMIQGLASRGHGRLKITALGSSGDRLEETGRRLSSFAHSMKLPFVFKSVVAELDKDGVEQQLVEGGGPDEAVMVYSGLHLWSKLATPSKLTTFLKFVKKLNPCVMVVNEIEADTNSSSLVERLCGALPFTIATFDCLDTCLRGEARCRNVVEEVFFRSMIQSIITAEEEEEGTSHRHAKIGFWREMFAEFDIVETELSSLCLDQARFMINRNADWSNCTLQMDGKCMIVGWRGTPLQSISAWKIHH